MTTGSWFHQAFGPDGGITADGIRNQLGRPELSALTVLVRESAQNAWDAKRGSTVRYGLDLRELTATEGSQWKRHLSWTSRGLGEDERALMAFFRGSTARVLFVSDRGTVGLGGPTRADRVASGQRNWLSFVLNSGEKRDVDGGGGTYGYGKGCFFILSRARTIVIHTRFEGEDGSVRSRLIGSAMLTHHEYRGVPYTGRHWWGIPRENHCDPLEDEAADELARLLGLPGFDKGDTGTTIAVLDPDLTDPTLPDDDSRQMSIAEAGRYLADAAAWNLWPLTLQGRQEILEIQVRANGESVDVPSENGDAALASFAAAYRAVVAPSGTDVRAGHAKARIGKLEVERTMGATVDSHAARELGLEGSPHHVCVMRRPELVVKYVQGRAREMQHLGYAGVFKADDSLDELYARSEPPTHDAWIDSQLAGREAMIVRSTYRRIAEATDAIAVVKGAGALHVGDSAAGVAYHLGALLEGLTGGGADPLGLSVDGDPSPEGPTSDSGKGGRATGGGATDSGGGAATSGGSATRPGALRAVGGTRLQEIQGRLFLARRYKVSGSGRYLGEAHVITGDGSIEKEPPAGSAPVRVFGWLVDGVLVEDEAREVKASDQDVVLLALPQPDVVIQLDVRKIS